VVQCFYVVNVPQASSRKAIAFQKSMEKKELLNMDVNDEREAENNHFGWVLNLQKKSYNVRCKSWIMWVEHSCHFCQTL